LSLNWVVWADNLPNLVSKYSHKKPRWKFPPGFLFVLKQPDEPNHQAIFN
jgi:hypothetical protein